VKAYISNIQRFSISDGPGIRTTVFFQGCPLKCTWCHNPECIDFSGKLNHAENYTANQLLDEILKDKLFYEESKGGVTFSGGEPINQMDFLIEISRLCKENDIHTAVDTSGYTLTGIPENLIRNTDLFLYDLKLIDTAEHKKFTSVDNKLILNNLKKLDSVNAELIIRIPLIPDITDTDWNIEQTIEVIHTLKNDYSVSLLPYHSMASGKYGRLNLDFRHKELETQSLEKIREIRKKFIKNNIRIYDNE
jgi:pyruvate formate lyase activating enzyme